MTTQIHSSFRKGSEELPVEEDSTNTEDAEQLLLGMGMAGALPDMGRVVGVYFVDIHTVALPEQSCMFGIRLTDLGMVHHRTWEWSPVVGVVVFGVLLLVVDTGMARCKLHCNAPSLVCRHTWAFARKLEDTLRYYSHHSTLVHNRGDYQPTLHQVDMSLKKGKFEPIAVVLTLEFFQHLRLPGHLAGLSQSVLSPPHGTLYGGLTK